MTDEIERAIVLMIYLVPIAELLICALVWVVLRAIAPRGRTGDFSPLVIAFGLVWLVLALVDMVITIGWPSPPSLATHARAASVLYAHGFFIAALVLAYLLVPRKRQAWRAFYAGAFATVHVLGLAWTEFLRVAIMTVD